MEGLRCNSWSRSGETSKLQWVNSKLGSFWSGFRIHKLDLKFISWISKSFQNDPLARCICLQMSITSSFQLRFAHRLKRWTPEFPRFKMIYITYKMDSIKCSKFVLKIRVYVTIRFLSSKFPCSWILLHASFSMFSCLLSYSIMVISHLLNSWYPHIYFTYGPWVLTHLFPHLALSWSFKI